MKNNKIRIAVVYLIPSLLILSSCVGSITNNIEKIEGKIDSKINAEAKVNTNVDTKVNANLSTGNITTQPNQSIVKDLDRFSELRVKNESNLDISFNRSQSRLFDDYKKIESFSFDKVKLKGNLNSYIEIVYDNDGIKYSNNLTFEYKESSNKVSLIIKSNGDFETINNGGGGELIVRDIKNNITKKLSVSVYDVSLEPKNEPIFTRPPAPTPTITANPSILPTLIPESIPTPTITSTPTPIPLVTPTPTVISTSTPIIPTLTPDPYGNEKRPPLIDGQINQPKGIYLRNGTFYVSYNKSSGSFSMAQGMLKLLNSTGSTIKDISGALTDSLPQELSGIASDGGRIWVLNRYSYAQSQHNIYSFLADGSGRMNAKLGSTETNFEDMAISTSTKTLYISSIGLNSIIKVNYLDNGAIDTASQKTDFISTVNPTGLCTDNNGNIYITDSSKNPPLISKYDSSGTKLLEFNSKGKKNDGIEASELRDIGVDSQGRIYVIAKVNGSFTILRYDIGGNFIRQFGSDFQDPRYIAVGDGVYITDFAKNTIHLYSSGK